MTMTSEKQQFACAKEQMMKTVKDITCYLVTCMLQNQGRQMILFLTKILIGTRYIEGVLTLGIMVRQCSFH